MIVNEQNNILDPKLDKTKQRDIITRMYADGGMKLTEFEMNEYLNDVDFKKNIKNLYTYSGNLKNYTPEKAEALYNSLLKPSVEKKNPDVNENQKSDSSLQSGVGPSSSVSVESNVTVDSNKTDPVTPTSTSHSSKQDWGWDSINKEGGIHYDQKYSYTSTVSKIPDSVLRMNEDDAIKILEPIFSDYGIEIETTGIGSDVLTFKAGDETFDFNLFTETYKNKIASANAVQFPGRVLDERRMDIKSIELLEQKRFEELKNWLKEPGRANTAVDNLASNMADTDALNLPLIIQSALRGSRIPPQRHFDAVNEQLREKIGFDLDYSFYVNEAGNFDENLWNQHLEEAKKIAKKKKFPINDSTIPYDFNSEEIDEASEKVEDISEIITEYDQQFKASNSIIGDALKKSGAYKMIDLNNKTQLKFLQGIGFNIDNIPLDAIKINGVAASFDDLALTLYDYDKVQAIRAGEMKIEIDESQDVGLLGNVLEKSKALIRVQEATETKGLFGFKPKFLSGVIDIVDSGLEKAENLTQSTLLGVWDIGVNLSYIGYDSLVGLGVNPKVADMMIYGNTGLPGISSFGSVMRPDYYDKVRNELLPTWEGNISDSDSVGEFVSKVVQPVGQSLATTALFIANPYAGLTVVGVNGYGGNMRTYEQQINVIKNKKKSGYVLTEEEENLLNMTPAAIRGMSGLKAANEVAWTSLFTMRYFQSLKNSIPKNLNEVDKRSFSNMFSKNFNTQYVKHLSNLMGIDKDLLIAETSEELLIAYTDYLIDVTYGNQDYDPKKVKSLLLDTGLTTLSSTVLNTKLINVYKNNRAEAIANGLIHNTITMKDENAVHSELLGIQYEIKSIEDELNAQGLNPTDNSEFNLLKDEERQLNQKIDKFENEKKDLLKIMKKPDKMKFIDILAEMSELNKAATNDSKRTKSKDLSKQKFENKRKELMLLLSKYPTKFSFKFAGDDIKSKYIKIAFDEIVKEKTDAGQEFDISTDDESVVDRASEMYAQDKKNQLIEIDNSIIRSKNRSFSQEDNPYEDEMLTGQTDLTKRIKLARETNQRSLFPEAENVQEPEKKRDEQDQKQIDELRIKIDELKKKEVLTQEESALQKSLEDQLQTLVSKDDFIDTEMQALSDDSNDLRNQEIADETADILDLSELENDLARRMKIYDRLEAANVDKEFYYSLPPKQQQVIDSFFDEVINGRKPLYGHIESLLDANDIAVEIASMRGDKIQLAIPKKDSKGNPLTNLFLQYNNFAQRIYAGGLFNKQDMATTEVLTQMLIKDKRLQKPLINLVMEANRKTKAAQTAGGTVQSKARVDYENLVKDWNGLNPNNKQSIDPNSPANSAELYVLALLKRQSKEKDIFGKDDEFGRIKGLLLEELKYRKKDVDSAIKNTETYNRALSAYNLWKSTLEKLDIENASSFDDVQKNAFPFNIAAVENINNVFSQEFDNINSHLSEFFNDKPFMYEQGTYSPMFMRTDNWDNSYSDMFGPMKETSKQQNLMDLTRPFDLDKGKIRLSPGRFFSNVYSTYTGTKIQASAYKDYLTFDNLLNNPAFTDMFEDGIQKDLLLDALKKRKGFFENTIRNTNAKNVDITNPKFPSLVDKFSSTAVQVIGVATLGRITQPLSQYFSAITGTSPLLKSKHAKQYLGQRARRFMRGAGNRDYTNFDAERGMSDVNGGFISNILEQSQTGFRNSILAELNIEQDSKRPASFYASALGFDETSTGWARVMENLRAGLNVNEPMSSARFTLDNILDGISKSSNSALDLFLGKADKLAAYDAFAAHYLDFMIEKGDKNADGSKAWWEGQNANPDIDAINHADLMVARVMRQTGAVSEASVYQPDATTGTKNIMRSLFLFNKFILNAKSDLSNQYSILLDETIPENQKEDARRAVEARIREVVSFGSIRAGGAIAGTAGLGGLIASIVGVDEEDYEERGGYDAMVAEMFLPIASTDEDFDARKHTRDQARNLEEYNLIVAAQADQFNNLMDVQEQLIKFGQKYDEKINQKALYDQVEIIMKEAVSLLNPLGNPNYAEGLATAAVNEVFDLDILEFVSSDFDRLGTGGGTLDVAISNAGVFGVGMQLYKNYVNAINLSKGYYIKDSGDNPQQKFYLDAPNNIMRKRLKVSTDILLALRTFSLALPKAPRAELDKIADILERSMYRNFAKLKEPSVYYEQYANIPSAQLLYELSQE